MRKIRILPSGVIILFLTLFAKDSFPQSVNANFSRAIKFGKTLPYRQSATLGTKTANINLMHDITYKLSFDSELIYADSLHISANRNLLDLQNEEYFEMQRIDSSYVLYSLTLKGRAKNLELDDLPINIDFTIKPEVLYQLIANNCEYTIEFKAESVTANDNSKMEIELSPFLLPIKLECKRQGENQVLIAAPNPTLERCWIHLPPNKKQKVDLLVLFNTAGKQQEFDSEINDDEIELNLDCLCAGHYYLNIIYLNNDRDVVKIVKL